MAVSFLPGELGRGPADRLLIAAARQLEVPIVTRDRLLLAYDEQATCGPSPAECAVARRA